MTRYQDLKELLCHVIEKEDNLTHYYDIAGKIVTNHKCRAVLKMLRDNHDCNLKVIRGIDIEDFGANEWIKYGPDTELKALLPEGELTPDSSVGEIVSHILDVETGMRDFYHAITREIVFRDERDLFESLVKFKERQIYEIKSCLSI
jgi:hypothetical protein